MTDIRCEFQVAYFFFFRSQMTLPVRVITILSLVMMLHSSDDVDAFIISSNIQRCFDNCENRFYDCLIFCDMASEELCERRCRGVLNDCAANCPATFVR